MRSIFRKLQWLIGRRRREAEFNAELQFHLDEEAEQRAAQGLTPSDSVRAAHLDLGNRTQVYESARAAWGWPVLTLAEQFLQDLRYALRTMFANRLFVAMAVLSLALGIGANTAIYSFMDALLLRTLPVRDPSSLVVLNWHAKSANHNLVMHSMSGTTFDDGQTGVTAHILPYPTLDLFRKFDKVFSTVIGRFPSWQLKSLNITVAGVAGLATGDSVTGNFFEGLGVPPAAGRLIIPGDDRPGAAAVAVVSYAYSQSRFGGPANAPGRSILINTLPFTVIGVTPPEFFGIDPAMQPDVYVPVHANELLGALNQFGFRQDRYLGRNDYWLEIIARLRPGVSQAQAEAVLAPAFHQWVASTATNDRERANLPELQVRPGAGGLDNLRRRYSQPLFLLMAMVALILMLACANVANLLLARAAARRREIALRLSVGAGRGRIIRQLLTESVLLASLGGVLGLLFAAWGIRSLTVLLVNGRTNFTLPANLNWHVLAAAAGLSLLTGVLFGLAPALQATRIDVMPALKETRAGQFARKRFFQRLSLSRALIVLQVAISLILLVAAGLFVRTLSNLQSISLGFNRENLLLFRVDARKAGHKDPEIANFYGELRKKLAEIPGVRSVSLSEDSLIEAGTGLALGLPGAPPDDNDRILSIGPRFFTTMQIPMLAGRDLDEHDRAGSPAVVVINEALAKADFPDRNPLGQRLTLREPEDDQRVARDMEIVGVCANARYGGLTNKIPAVAYLPYNQGYPRPDQMVYELRTAGDPLIYARTAREIVRRADPRVLMYEVRTQAADIDRTIGQEITFARLCTGFALLALAIACVGLYGTVSYNVARRTNEIGIRMALGAQRSKVVRMVLSEVLLTAAAGLAIGVAVALTAARFVASFLYGLKANDPMALAAALGILLTAALAAGYVPARRASRIDPMTTLRHE